MTFQMIQNQLINDSMFVKPFINKWIRSKCKYMSVKVYSIHIFFSLYVKRYIRWMDNIMDWTATSLELHHQDNTSGSMTDYGNEVYTIVLHVHI